MNTTRHHRPDQLAADTPAWLADVDAAPATDGLGTALAGSPLFAGMDPDEIERVITAFDEARYPSGHRVVLEGLSGSDFFVVVVGRAAVLIDGWRVATLGPGDFFGELAILGNGLRTASVRAETPLHCLVLPNGKLEKLIIDHPLLSSNILHTVVTRFVDQSGRTQPPAVEMDPA